MSPTPAVSIIINNYNYARFLRAAIESALAQQGVQPEVIVVDDGSTDDSRGIIKSYESCVRPIFQRNGGQTAAINAGFARSSGDVVIFLDADDVLYPHAARCAAEALAARSDVLNVRWPMDVIDADGRCTGAVFPSHPLQSGDFRDTILSNGPSSCPAAPTSGNAWSRRFLKRVLPAPMSGDYFRLGADEYLSNLAPLFGAVVTLPQRLGSYRVHGSNRYTSMSFEQKLRFELDGHEQQCAVLERVARELGHTPNVAQWSERSWFRRIARVIDEIDQALPASASIVLIDDNTWGTDRIASHSCIPFLERDGQYYGAAADDQTAIAEIDRVRQRVTPFVALTWPSFWWFDAFPRFAQHLRTTSRCMLENDRVMLFGPKELTHA